MYDHHYMIDRVSTSAYRHTTQGNNNHGDDWTNAFPPLPTSTGDANRTRLDSNSSYSTDSSAGGTKKKRSHRPRGCRGGGSRRARKEKRAAAAAAAALAESTTENVAPPPGLGELQPLRNKSIDSSTNQLELPSNLFRVVSAESTIPSLLAASSSMSASGDWTHNGYSGLTGIDASTTKFSRNSSFTILPSMPPGQLLQLDESYSAKGMTTLPPRISSGQQPQLQIPGATVQSYALVPPNSQSVGPTSYPNASSRNGVGSEDQNYALALGSLEPSSVENTGDSGSLFMTSPRSFLLGGRKQHF